MSTFIISPLNSLTFKKLDGLLPNYNNTLDRFDLFQDAINIRECQKFLTTETIITQIRTDYDTIVATLYDEDGNDTVLTVTEMTTYTNYNFYEFSVTGLSAGKYRVIVEGSDATFPDVLFECEPFELVSGILVKSGNTTVRIIENYKKVVYYQTENSFYIDYTTGIEHFFWIPARIFKLIPSGEIDIYNNLDNKEKLEQTNFRGYTFESDQIPRHLAVKFSEASSMDYFTINDIEYILPEIVEPAYYGDSNLATINIQIEERFTIGVNSDDQGYPITESESGEGFIMNIGENNLSAGTAQYTVSEGYAVRHIDWRLVSGSSAALKFGTTPGGDDISKEKTISSIGGYITIDRSKVLDWDGTGTVYVTKTGVGSVVDVWLTTISFKDISV